MNWYKCIYDNTQLNNLIDRSITSIKNDTVTSIGEYAFSDCEQLVSADFPNVTTIGSFAFYWCLRLNNIHFPNATTIQNSAFYSDAGFAYLDLVFPKVTSIGNNAFEGTYISSITLGASTMCTLSNANAFRGTQFDVIGEGGTLYVPSNLISTYQADTNWSTVLGWNADNQILAIPE